MQDRCAQISCARSLCHDVCVRILYDHLYKISVCGSLVQGLSVRMSAAGSCRTTCARSLHQDLLCKISQTGSLRQDLCRTICRRPSPRLHKRNFTSIPRDGHAPSLQSITLGNQKSQLYQHFARWTHTISAEGCTSTSEIATLPAFCTMDTRDLRRGLHFEIRNRNFTSISCDGHARSPQRVALRNQKSQLYLHSVPSTRTISAEGCTSKSENATLPISAEGPHFETMLQKSCGGKEIMSRGHTKCCTAKTSPSSSSKNATPVRN